MSIYFNVLPEILWLNDKGWGLILKKMQFKGIDQWEKRWVESGNIRSVSL